MGPPDVCESHSWHLQQVRAHFQTSDSDRCVNHSLSVAVGRDGGGGRKMRGSLSLTCAAADSSVSRIQEWLRVGGGFTPKDILTA